LLSAIDKACEQFKNENEKEFRVTNGYPSSYWDDDAPNNDPFLAGEDETEMGEQSLYGAQWLVRYLMGKDLKGFVPKRNVPTNLQNPPNNQTPYAQKDWYSDTVVNGQPIDRVGPYLDPGSVKLARLDELPGIRNNAFFPQFDVVSKQPVIVDNFDHPILYYVANPLGRTMCTHDTSPEIIAPSTVMEQGIYRHEDNAGFTGRSMDNMPPGDVGWVFSAPHRLGIYGPQFYNGASIDLDNVDNQGTFVAYINDTQVQRVASVNLPTGSIFRHQPVNKDRFILISAGKDGIWGTKDDVKNFDKE
jgi:hypothetical protein